jgi:hypothetical protein
MHETFTRTLSLHPPIPPKQIDPKKINLNSKYPLK